MRGRFHRYAAEAGGCYRPAHARGLEVQFELGKKHTGAFSETTVLQLIEQGRRCWTPGPSSW